MDRGAWAAYGGNLAAELRALRRSKGFPRHARVVSWEFTGSSRHTDPAVSARLKPLLAAGFRIHHILTPPEALAEIARRRPRAPGHTAAWLALNVHGAAIAIVRDGRLLFGRTFEWNYSFDIEGPRAEMLQRYSIVSHLAPEVRRGISLVRSSYGASVETAITSGDLPDLRSLTMPLIEELDLEVETLDSSEGLHAAGRARSDRFAELAPVLRLAAAAATAPVRRRRRIPVMGRMLRFAAAAAIVATAASLAYRYWPVPARRAADRVTTDSVGVPTPTSGISPASSPRVRDLLSTPGTSARGATPVLPSTAVSTTTPPVTVAQPRAPTRGVEAPPQRTSPPAVASPPLMTPPPAAQNRTDAPVSRPEPPRAWPMAKPPVMESVATGADTGRREPVPLKDAVPSVDSILVSQERRFAIVGGRILSVGDRIGPRVVAEIERDAVVLQEPSGHRIRIPIRPDPNDQCAASHVNQAVDSWLVGGLGQLRCERLPHTIGGLHGHADEEDPGCGKRSANA
jgi:hypothetical protein